MTKTRSGTQYTVELSRRAREIVMQEADQALEDISPLSPEDCRQTLHDMRVLQIELEMQNEELRRAQVELDITRARYFDLYDLAPVGYCTIDRNGRILEANLTAATLLGVARGALVNQPLTRFILKEDLDTYSLKQILLFKTGQSQGLELRIVKEDGTMLWVHLETTIALNADGESVSRVALTDVPERQRAEEALRDSERRYRIIFERSPLALISFDSEGTIVDFNDKFVEMMGSSREKLLGINTARQSSPKMREAIKKALAGETATFEDLYTSITAGRTAYLRAKFSPVVPGRSPTDVIATLEDITELKRHEAEQHKLEKLESLGVLAGGIAHDFNNVLTGIMANISFAKLLIEPCHAAGKPLEEAEKATKRAAEISQQLLTFARGGEPNKKVISFQHLILESASLMLRGSNVKAVLNVPESLHSLIADEGQISQVLNNLILNAAQSMPGGGTLTVTANNIALSAGNSLGLPAGSYVKAELRDQGCGISPENLKRIFDPYFSTKAAGTGLGLASAFSIIQRHNGNISVNSTNGAGTVFTLYLPSIDISRAEHRQSASEKSGKGQRGTVLVMEDEEMIRDIVATMLNHLGYKAKTCASGEEAVELYLKAVAAGDPFRAVIMDLTIPGGMGGKQAAEQILASFPKARLIVSSGYSNDPVMANFKEFGFCGAIAKPYNVREFEQVLNSLLEN